MPEVTICIPAYNADKYLPESLDSVRIQSFQDWDLIVTEDGSKDRTEEIVNDFAKKVSQTVTYQRHPQNKGLSATRNTCIRTASSPLLAFLDSDDCWKPEHLEIVVNIFKDPDMSIVHSGSILFENDTGKEISIRTPSPQDVIDFPLSLYLNRYIIQPSSAVVHRRVFESVGGFDEEMFSVEDLEFWFRAASNGFRFACTGALTCLYRKHGDALSDNSLKMIHFTARAYEKHLNWLELPKSLRKRTTSEAFANAGRMNFRKSPRAAFTYYLNAWKIKPESVHFLFFSILACLLSLFRHSPKPISNT